MMTTASAKGRKVEPGISWVWYTAETREDAISWYAELTGNQPTYDWIICEVLDGRYGFRLRMV